MEMGYRMAPSEKPVQTTTDGRYLIIKGRRWRASDPSIPAKLRQELVNELMSARRAVKQGEIGASKRVNNAKLALGERGQPWWEEPESDSMGERIRATIRSLLSHRANTSICPSDVARIVGGPDEGWRKYMGQVRQIAAALAVQGEVVATQNGEPVEADGVKGPIRIRRRHPGE
ncbi:DUF3253 domain-containing protein [Glutamicibacter sp.]|uniref:DUF3253 domain-containing protein n=2 Tax=Micrococcales TaxID=85006 RepID=UPI001AAF4F1B